jgi:hypothetical protein
MSGRETPYVAVPRSVPTPGGPSRYRTTRSTPVVLPLALRSIVQPQINTVPETLEFGAGRSMKPIGSPGNGNGVGAGVAVAGVGVGVTATGVGVTTIGVGVTAIGVGVTTIGVGVTAIGVGVTTIGVGVTAIGVGVTTIGVGVTTTGVGAAVGVGTGAIAATEKTAAVSVQLYCVVHPGEKRPMLTRYVPVAAALVAAVHPIERLRCSPAPKLWFSKDCWLTAMVPPGS